MAAPPPISVELAPNVRTLRTFASHELSLLGVDGRGGTVILRELRYTGSVGALREYIHVLDLDDGRSRQVLSGPVLDPSERELPACARRTERRWGAHLPTREDALGCFSSFVADLHAFSDLVANAAENELLARSLWPTSARSGGPVLVVRGRAAGDCDGCTISFSRLRSGRDHVDRIAAAVPYAMTLSQVFALSPSGSRLAFEGIADTGFDGLIGTLDLRQSPPSYREQRILGQLATDLAWVDDEVLVVAHKSMRDSRECLTAMRPEQATEQRLTCGDSDGGPPELRVLDGSRCFFRPRGSSVGYLLRVGAPEPVEARIEIAAEEQLLAILPNRALVLGPSVGSDADTVRIISATSVIRMHLGGSPPREARFVDNPPRLVVLQVDPDPMREPRFEVAVVPLQGAL